MGLEELEDGNKITMGSRTIYIRNNARLVRGYRGNGLRLNGVNQYMEADKGLACGGDLDKCSKGFTSRFRVKANELRDNTYFMSSAPFDVYYKDGKIKVDYRSAGKKWQVESRDLHPDAWYLVETSWDPVEGLSLYINGVRKSTQVIGDNNPNGLDLTRKFYVGRANSNMRNERFLNGILDDLEFYEAKRNYLITRGLIDGGKWATGCRKITCNILQ